MLRISKRNTYDLGKSELLCLTTNAIINVSAPLASSAQFTKSQTYPHFLAYFLRP